MRDMGVGAFGMGHAATACSVARFAAWGCMLRWAWVTLMWPKPAAFSCALAQTSTSCQVRDAGRGSVTGSRPMIAV